MSLVRTAAAFSRTTQRTAPTKRTTHKAVDAIKTKDDKITQTHARCAELRFTNYKTFRVINERIQERSGKTACSEPAEDATQLY